MTVTRADLEAECDGLRKIIGRLETKNKRLRDALEQIVLWRGADAGATQAADIADAALGERVALNQQEVNDG